MSHLFENSAATSFAQVGDGKEMTEVGGGSHGRVSDPGQIATFVPHRPMAGRSQPVVRPAEPADLRSRKEPSSSDGVLSSRCLLFPVGLIKNRDRLRDFFRRYVERGEKTDDVFRCGGDQKPPLQ